MRMIEARDITVTRNGRTLLHSISLVADRGDIVGIVGPNGAGKSTLLRVLAGDIPPDGGSASLSDENVAETTLRRLAWLRAFVGPQSDSDVGFSGADVVAMGLHTRRVNVEGDQLALDAMASLDVANLGDRVMRTLSSGEQQRVHLARAIVQQAPVLLLDEPTSALDVGHQEMVMRVLRQLALQGTAVVAVLHDLNLAAAHADRLLLLDSGESVASGPPREVLTADRLSAAYREPMDVVEHPFRDRPLVLTTGGEAPKR